MRLLFLAIICLPVVVPGCAHYSTSSGLIGGIRSVAIPDAENRHRGRARVGSPQRARQRCLYHGWPVARCRSGERRRFVVAAPRRPRGPSPSPLRPRRRRSNTAFRVWVDATLLKSEDDSELLELQGLEGWGTYDAAIPDEDGRDVAIAAALDMVIEEIVDRTTASW